MQSATGSQSAGVAQGALKLGALHGGKEHPEQLEHLEVVVDWGTAALALPTEMRRTCPLEWHSDGPSITRRMATRRWMSDAVSRSP